MMPKLVRPIRQMAAVALLIAALALIWGIGVLPLRAHLQHLSDEIDNERATLGRFAAVAALEERLAETQRAGRAASASAAYLQGEGDQIKSATLQTLLSSIAAENGLRLSSARALNPLDRNELKLIGVRVQFTANIEQLREILYAAESRQPFLFVDGLQVRTVSPLAHDPEHAGILDVRADIYGVAARKRG
jgi:general secretion pathway protein M